MNIEHDREPIRNDDVIAHGRRWRDERDEANDRLDYERAEVHRLQDQLRGAVATMREVAAALEAVETGVYGVAHASWLREQAKALRAVAGRQ